VNKKNSKSQVPNSKERKSMKKKEETPGQSGFISSLLEFYYSLEFGFWNLEFMGKAGSAAGGLTILHDGQTMRIVISM
jgi:hypothetical protein